MYTKWDGRRHWHFQLRLLGQDKHGVWLAAPPGTLLQRGEEPPMREDDGFVMLVPGAGSWTGIWNVEDDPEIYIDVTTAPQWSGDKVTAVDLDLDVVRHRDGTVAILDEDEFEEHRVAFGYPPDVVDTATATARRLHDALGQRSEPFGSEARRWFAQLRPLP